MTIVRFDEHELIGKLSRMPAQLRVSFALLCAERLLPGYIEFCTKTGRGDADALCGIVARLWRDIEGDKMADDELSAALSACMRLIPTEDDGPWVDEQAYAEDSASAVAYAIRTRQSGESQEAAWAARRAYEAIDHFVINRQGISPYEVGGEERVLSHPLTQAELTRQLNDIQALRKIASAPHGPPTLSELRIRAERDAPEFFGKGSN